MVRGEFVLALGEADIQTLLGTVQGKLCYNPDNPECKWIISTGHRAKGREWPVVVVADEFNPDPSKGACHSDDRLPAPGSAKQREEACLVYVAMTRARERLFLPRKILSVLWVKNRGLVYPFTPTLRHEQAAPSDLTAKPSCVACGAMLQRHLADAGEGDEGASEPAQQGAGKAASHPAGDTESTILHYETPQGGIVCSKCVETFAFGVQTVPRVMESAEADAPRSRRLSMP